MTTLPQLLTGQGHQIGAELRKLEDIASTLDKALSDARELKNRNSELERLITLAHHEAWWMAGDEDEQLNSFI